MTELSWDELFGNEAVERMFLRQKSAVKNQESALWPLQKNCPGKRRSGHYLETSGSEIKPMRLTPALAASARDSATAR